jgi:hypothetical protein
MLNNNQITPRSDLSSEQKEKISTLLAELANYHGFDKIEYIPSDFSVDRTLSVFGFDYYFSGGDNTRFLSLGADYSQGYEITGFDRSYEFFIFKSDTSKIGNYVAAIELNKLVIKQNEIALASLDLETKILDLYAKHGNSKFEIASEELIFVFDNNPNFKLLIKNISATLNANDSVILESITAILLVNE